MPFIKSDKMADAATATLRNSMDERQMVKVRDQVQPLTLNCKECGKRHIFRYSHLKLDKGKRYSVYVGVPCFAEYLEEIGVEKE